MYGDSFFSKFWNDGKGIVLIDKKANLPHSKRSSLQLADERGCISVKRVTLPYTVQLGVFRSSDVFYNTMASFRERGLNVFWVKCNSNEGKAVYRIVSGNFKTRQQAERYRKKLGIKDSFTTKMPYALLVAKSSSFKEISKIKARLMARGYGCYVVKAEDGRYELLIGMFKTKEEARGELKELLYLKINP